VYIRLAWLSISRDLCIYRQHDVTLLHKNGKIFPKQMRYLSLIGLDQHRKYQNIRFTKLEHLGFATLYFSSSFFIISSCTSPFFYAPNVSGLQVIFMFSILLIFILKLSKPEHLRYQTRLSDFPRLVKFGHKHMIPSFLVKLAY
jgi:hypothetical protein